jgi:hypothetical protein
MNMILKTKCKMSYSNIETNLESEEEEEEEDLECDDCGKVSIDFDLYI